MTSLRATLPLLACLVACGCGSRNPVAGTVSVEGRKLARGYITFFPVGAEGHVVGADVVEGKFAVADLAPGKRKVLVTTHPQIDVKQTPDGKKWLTGIAAPALGASVAGNNRVIDIPAGSRDLDVKLGWYRRRP